MSSKVSVIVPVFNQEKYIARCIRSLQNQNLNASEFDIIVIDDGSTDQTGLILRTFENPESKNLKIIYNEENYGLPKSLNIGIKASKSEFIVRVDSDDYVNKNFLNFLKTYIFHNDSIGALSSDYLLVDENENILERVNCDERPIGCGIIFRKSLLEEIGLYDEKFLCNEEIDLMFRFKKNYKIERLPIPLYRYRRHKDNITNKDDLMDYYYQELAKKHNIENKTN